MNRKEARARTTQAIEKISLSIATSIQQQAQHFDQTQQRLAMDQERHKSSQTLDQILIEKKRKESLKADLDLLRVQLDFKLISSQEFESKAKCLFTSL